MCVACVNSIVQKRRMKRVAGKVEKMKICHESTAAPASDLGIGWAMRPILCILFGSWVFRRGVAVVEYHFNSLEFNEDFANAPHRALPSDGLEDLTWNRRASYPADAGMQLRIKRAPYADGAFRRGYRKCTNRELNSKCYYKASFIL